jgi:hypothetical protein
MFKVKIKSKDETLYYTVYAVERFERPTQPPFKHPSFTKTEFLIYDSEKGFHWVDASLCETV